MNQPKHRRGFTLLETLLASALLGALLLALNFFVFSMAEIWGHGSERRLFEQHVRAVTRELEEMIRSSALPPLGTQAGVFTREIKLDNGQHETPLSFELLDGSPRLPWSGPALPDVVCSLVAQRDRGLVIYWQSRLETKFDDAAPRAWILTPFVQSVAYDYQDPDTKSWRNSDTLQRDAKGQWQIPTRIRLQFEHAGMKAETSVMLPMPPGPLPHF
ncbi:MAG TPA: prepilin-type N-terminal cleavage/methylation domain-containing protein [Candidatus Didemnitutus sp.]|nr:prepilin-type N-terminal cleavage/methylation domain-containing protein [Candidatus Didemnitutus sp.]